MMFSVLLFLTIEIWEVFSDLPTRHSAILAGLFVALGTAFLVARLPREVRTLEREAVGEGPELDRHQRPNVGLVMFVSQAMQVLLVTLALAAFFVALGLFAIDEEVRRS